MSIANYLQETKGELKHVSWPTQRQATVYTSLVILFSVIVGVLLGVFDVIFNYLLALVI